MELIFLIGIAWAASRGIEALKAPASARWAKYQKARSGRDNSPAARAQRRAASTAVLGFWAGETARLFPHLRHGFAQGWTEHREQVTQRERERARTGMERELGAARQDADDAGWWARTRAELAAHRHRLEVARAQAEREPTMTEQLTAEQKRIRELRWYPDGDPYNPGGDHPMRGENCTDPNCDCHENDGPMPGMDNVSVNHRLQEAWDHGGPSPEQRRRAQEGNGAPAGSPPAGTSTGGNMASGDMNYDVAVDTSEKLIAAAEQAANSELLDTATQMADELGGMAPDDSAMLSLAADVVAAAQKLKEGSAELQDRAVALKSHLVTNYGPIQEAVDAGPGAAPEKEFVTH